MANETPTAEPAGNVMILILAWMVVGLPLLWGVAQTFKKTLALFH
jgi:hypothetical protein